MTRESSPSRSGVALGLVLLIVALFWFEGWRQPPQVDDAYISYRYARNLAAGHGLVYNVGEWVEGYSNLLWTLLLAVGIGLGLQATDVAHGLGLASGTAALLVAFAYASAGIVRSRRWIAALAPGLVLAWIGFPVWTLSGLETPLFAALVACALAAEARGRLGLGTAAALVATLTRPEGPLLAAVILGVNALRGAPQGRRRAFAWAAVFAVGLALLTGFRMYYYGSLVPNTFYAKAGHNVWVHGVGDLGRFLFSGVLPLLVPAVWAVRRDRACQVGALWAVAMGLYIISVGGDVFPHHRFWVPVYLVVAVFAARALILQRELKASMIRELPLWIFVVAGATWSLYSARYGAGLVGCLGVAAVAGVWGARARWRVVIGGLVGAGLVILVAVAPWVDDAKFAQRNIAVAILLNSPPPPADAPGSRLRQVAMIIAQSRRGLSRNHTLRATLGGRRDHLRRATNSARRIMVRREGGEQVDLVAATAIGKFGYDLPVSILDMLGLVDAHIARSPPYKPTEPVLWLPGHMRTDAEYILSRRPDYIFIQRSWSVALRLPVHDDLWSNPDLERMYEWDEEMTAYRRRR